jgi:G6PDH family F420-dependent oxidoreductase
MSEVPEVPVGTSVTCPMLRYRPPLLAQMVATLDNMFPGRLHLGVGTGEALNEAHFVEGEWPDWGTRAGMLIETIDLLRDLWNSTEYVAHDGKYFTYDGIKLYTRPKEPIDVHWAAWGPQSCRAAGEYADHLLTATSPENIAENIVPNFETGLERAGRSLADAEVTTEMFASVGDPEALVAEIRERGEYIPDESELDTPDPRAVQAVADERLAEMSDEEIREANSITDDADEIVAKLERYEEAGVDRVLVGSTCGDPRATIETFADDVIPHFSE